MNRKEIKAKVTELISSGVAKTEVFAKLTGQGVKDRVLAHFIASYADPQRCRENRGHIRAVVAVAYLQLILGAAFGFFVGSQISPAAGLVIGGLAAAFAILFIWGFSKNLAGAYNAYLILTVIQLPRQVIGIAKDPLSAAATLLIGLGLFCYIWYVRNRLFPDFSFIAPRKVNGRYVFSE